MSSSTSKNRKGKEEASGNSQQPSSQPSHDVDATTKTHEKTDGRTKTGKTDKTSTTKNENNTETKNTEGRSEGVDVIVEEKKKDASGGITSGGTEGKGSEGKLSETGRKTSERPEKIGQAIPATTPAAIPPVIEKKSVNRTETLKTAKCESVATAQLIGAPSHGRKSVPLVIAKPSGPRATVKSNTPSASSTTKGSSGTDKNSKPRTPGTNTPGSNKSIMDEKSCIAPEESIAPRSWKMGWPIAGVIVGIILILFLTIIYFTIAKGVMKGRDDSTLEEAMSVPMAIHSRREEGTVKERVKFRLREPPDPPSH